MATKKETIEEVKEEVKEPKDELVEFYAFKDNGKYKDDIVVGINGKFLRIQRGVRVKIPKPYYDVLMQSQEQDAKTAYMMEGLQDEYKKAEKILG